ncbi:hypothetical protein Aperf_G00000074648 [Anoplocephala perfoliata]
MASENFLEVVTLDGVEIKVSKLHCTMSRVLWKLFNCKDEMRTVNIIPIRSEIFKKILSWLQYHEMDVYNKLEELEFKDFEAYDASFFAIDDSTLMEISKAAYWLGIDILVELCAIALAHTMEGKSVEEIRELFKEVNDFEPEEEELLRKEAEHPYFGLNTTAESVAYFITGTGPPNGLNAQNWLQMEPRLVSLSPVAQIFAKDNSEIEEYVFITDSTQDCYDLRENVSSNFKWSILGSDNSTEMLVEVTRLKPHIENLKVHFAICDAGKELQFSKMTLDLLLKTGLYSGSEAYIYTYANMKNTTNYDMMKAFADAGAYLATVTPALSSSNMDAVELTKNYLVALAQNYVLGSDLLLNGKKIPFTSANFLRLIQATPYTISDGNMDMQISFSEEGASRVVNFYFCEFPSSSTITCTSGYYYHTGKELKLDIELNEKQKVKLLAFQDLTFLPSYANTETSKAILMVQQIFTSNLPYSYELVNATFDKTKTIQETIVKTLKDSETTYTMSAFPILLDSDLGVPQSSTVFYDGIVMIKIRKATTVNLFHIFDAISGLIWLCVFASLIFVALIFFIIKVANDYRTRQLGLVPEDQDIPLLRQFFNVIYQNFSAVLLAKVLVKPKQTSIKVLYQSYWIASILFVATYAAALADQRFGTQATSVPFDSLRGLAYNTGGYKWFFLRNSSVVWKMKNSKDSVLNKLMSEAENKWASKMYVESVADAVSRIEGDSHQILIASRLEVKRILSEECQLTKMAAIDTTEKEHISLKLLIFTFKVGTC